MREGQVRHRANTCKPCTPSHALTRPHTPSRKVCAGRQARPPSSARQPAYGAQHAVRRLAGRPNGQVHPSARATQTAPLPRHGYRACAAHPRRRAPGALSRRMRTAHARRPPWRRESSRPPESEARARERERAGERASGLAGVPSSGRVARRLARVEGRNKWPDADALVRARLHFFSAALHQTCRHRRTQEFCKNRFPDPPLLFSGDGAFPRSVCGWCAFVAAGVQSAPPVWHPAPAGTDANTFNAALPETA